MTRVKVERKGSYQGVAQWGITGAGEITPSKATAEKWARLENAAIMTAAKEPWRRRCNQCEASMINGVFCHETGCPNTHARYDEQSGEWRKQRKCFDCGCMVDAEESCCTGEPMDEYERRQRG